MILKDKFKKIFNKKALKEEIPFNGGNLYNSKIKIDNKEDRMLNWASLERLNGNFNNTLSGLNNTISYTYQQWYLLNFISDYFISNFNWKAPTKEINYLLHVLFRTHFLYGNVGVYYKDKKFIPIVISVLKSNEFNEPIEIQGTIAYDMLNNEILDTKSYFNDKHTKIIKIKDLENFTILRVNSMGISGLIKWLPFVRQQEDILKKIYNASILINKKLVYNCNDENVAISEIKALFNNNTPFIINKDIEQPHSNLFNTDTQIDNDTQYMFDYYNNFLKVYYSILGRRINIDTKKERNISIEVEASQDNLRTLEREEYYLKYFFINELNDKYALNIEIEEWEEEKNEIRDISNGEQNNTIQKP